MTDSSYYETNYLLEACKNAEVRAAHSNTNNEVSVFAFRFPSVDTTKESGTFLAALNMLANGFNSKICLLLQYSGVDITVPLEAVDIEEMTFDTFDSENLSECFYKFAQDYVNRSPELFNTIKR